MISAWSAVLLSITLFMILIEQILTACLVNHKSALENHLKEHWNNCWWKNLSNNPKKSWWQWSLWWQNNWTSGPVNGWHWPTNSSSVSCHVTMSRPITAAAVILTLRYCTRKFYLGTCCQLNCSVGHCSLDDTLAT